MNLRYQGDTERAVAPVIALLFAVSILMMAAAQQQVLVVPQEERQAEATHHRLVENQLSDLRASILTASSNGQLQSQQITLGTRYEFRLIYGFIPAVHQMNPSGRLESVHPDNRIIVRNAENKKGASNYWNGAGPPCDDTPQCYNTTFISYTPDYNHYQTAPTTVYENTMLYDRYTNANGSHDYVLRSDQSLVNGRTINLVTVTGDISTSQVSPATVEAHPVSAPANTISITDNSSGKPLTVQIPTQLPESQWRKILKDQMASNPDGYIQSLSVSNGVLTLKFAPDETYNLRLSRIHLRTRQTGDPVPETEPAYLAWRGSDKITVRENARQTVKGQVRDKYNNGVSGVKVNATAEFTSGDQRGECAGSFESAIQTCPNGERQPGKLISDESGNIEFVYSAPEVDGDESITVNLAIASGEQTISDETTPWANAEDGQTLSYTSNEEQQTGAFLSTNSGTIGGDETLRIVDFRFRRSIIPRGETAVATVILQNTGETTRTGLTLNPFDPDGTDNFIATPGSISGISLAPGERRRYAFKFRFTKTGTHAVQIHGANTELNIVHPNSTSLSGVIENKGEDQEVNKDASRFKDGDANPSEYLEDRGIPPIKITDDSATDTSRGNLFDLQGATKSSNYTHATIRRKDVNIGIATYYLPDNDYYTLRLKYRYTNPDMNRVNVTVVSADGDEVDKGTTYQLGNTGTKMKDVYFHLSDKEAKHVREQNELLLVYNGSKPSSEDVKLDIARHQTISSETVLDVSKPNLSVSSLSVTPGNPSVGESVTITATLKNSGQKYASKRVVLTQSSATQSLHGARSTDVLVNPKSSKTITFTHYFYEPGNYTLGVGKKSEKVTVSP